MRGVKLFRRALLAGGLAVPFAARAGELAEVWRDAGRRRDVPVLMRLPQGVPPHPLVIVSHGLGGTRYGLGYLGAALAEAGMAVLHLQHAGSDAAILQGPGGPALSMAAAVMDPARARARLADVAFALAAAGRHAALAPIVDFAAVAVAGHSFGAWTVTHVLGERLAGEAFLGADWGLELPVPGIRAGVALSPVPPLGVPAGEAFERVVAPILYVTGTRDRGVIEAANPVERQIPFRRSRGPAALAVLAGASHASFAGEAGAGPAWNEPTWHGRTARLATLFLRAALRGDAAAEALLRRGGGLMPADVLELRGDLAPPGRR